MKEVVIIEDDSNIAELLEIHLKDMHFNVVRFGDGIRGLDYARNNHFDLMILDLSLPGMNGLDLCQTLRAEKVKQPILMLTAKTEEIDKVLGLESGADDYMTKPFSIREFQARVKAIFRRAEIDRGESEDTQSLISSKDLVIDKKKRKISIGGLRVELTPKEFDLLYLLASHRGVTYDRKELLNLVWGADFDGYEHTVNSHINRLRAKIERDPDNPEYVLTSWGVGYRFSDV